MRPRLVDFFEATIGTGFFVPDNAFFQALATLLGFYLVIMLAERAKLDTRRVFKACLFVVVFAMISSKIYYALIAPEYYAGRWLELFKFWEGGSGSMGAYLGGALAVVLAARWQQLPLGKLVDCMVPAVVLAIVLMRIGCFLNGCCFGAATDVPWAVQFPPGSMAHQAHLADGLLGPEALSLAVHPVQLYAALAALVLLTGLLWYRPRRRRDGALLVVFCAVYPVGRFLLEFFRGDGVYLFATLTVQQVVCVIVVALTLMLWLAASQKRRFYAHVVQ